MKSKKESKEKFTKMQDAGKLGQDDIDAMLAQIELGHQLLE
jgi:phage tail tape-measure protein